MKPLLLRLLAVTLIALALVLSAIPVSATPKTTAPNDGAKYTFYFNESTSPWQPFTYKLPVTNHTLVVKDDENGNSYAALTTPAIDGVWMQAALPSGGNTFNLIFYARNMGNSGNIQPVAYVGSEKPPSFGDLEPVGAPLTRDWQPYVVSKTLAGSTAVVAIGYISDGPAWIAVDSVVIRMYNR